MPSFDDFIDAVKGVDKEKVVRQAVKLGKSKGISKKSLEDLAKEAAQNEIANKLVEDMLEKNPALVEKIMEENLRVLVIFAITHPQLFDDLLGGERDKKAIIATIKENPDEALKLALENKEEIASFAWENKKLIGKYAWEYKDEILEVIAENSDVIKDVISDPAVQDAVKDQLGEVDTDAIAGQVGDVVSDNVDTDAVVEQLGGSEVVTAVAG